MSPIESRTDRCASCSQPASFITPVGMFCADHAMAETLNQGANAERWMPVPIQAA